MKKVRVYEGSIPKSGKNIFEYAGIKLMFRSVKKECLVVHVDTKAVIMALPSGSELSTALNFLTKHYNMLLDFILEPQSFELYVHEHLPKLTKQQLQEANMKPIEPITKEKSYSDRGCVSKPKEKRTFNLVYQKYK